MRARGKDGMQSKSAMHKNISIEKEKAKMNTDEKANHENPRNPVKAIRLKCRDCCCNQVSEIDACTVKGCALHPFRFGKNPYRTKRILTDEQKVERAKHLKRPSAENNAHS